MKVSVSLYDMKGLQIKLENITAAMGKHNTGWLVLEQAELLKHGVMENAPVGETGNLQRSPKARLLPTDTDTRAVAMVWTDENTAPYASLVEYGTSRVAAHPFFRPAMDNMRSSIIAGIKEGVKRIIEGAG